MKKNLTGYGLEKYIEILYKDLGYNDVKRNVVFKKSSGAPIDAQIDLTYKNYLGYTVFVECKYHKKSKVTFSEYSKFVQILNALQIPKMPIFYRGELITNSYFDSRTLQLAESERIKLIDIDALKELEKRRKSIGSIIVSGINALDLYKKEGSFSTLKYVLERFLPIETQIKYRSK